jgi:apolipoprotein N-acyltransferase
MSLRPRLLACAAVAASACAFALYARVEYPWLVLGWIALVPWLALVDRTRSTRAALGAGLLMCEGFVLAVFGWFAAAIQNYTGASWPMAMLVLLLLAPLLQPQFIAFAAARHLVQRHAGGFWRVALIGACVYVGTEWASPKLFGDTLGHGLYASALMRQAADLAGAHGLTFVLIVANECALRVIHALVGRSEITPAPSDHHRAKKLDPPQISRPGFRTRIRRALPPAGCVAALVVGLLAYGAVRIDELRSDGSPRNLVTAGLVQADISHYGRLASQLGTFDAVRMILNTHFALSEEAMHRGDLDLLVWPETVYPTTFGSPKSEEGAAFDREIGAFVESAGVPLVFGAYDIDGGEEFNAAVFMEPAADGQVAFQTYRKESLFPLTERVPWLMQSDLVRRWLPWLGAWKPGRGPRVLPLKLRNGRVLRIAPLICYDAVDPSHTIDAVRHGADFIVTLSNDSWFAAGAGPRLHLVVSAFRSIETRRPQLRATNTGISAVITATGDLLGTIGVDKRAILVEAVTPAHGATTLMLAWGDWFGPTALISGAVLLALSLAKRRPQSGHGQAG